MLAICFHSGELRRHDPLGLSGRTTAGVATPTLLHLPVSDKASKGKNHRGTESAPSKYSSPGWATPLPGMPWKQSSAKLESIFLHPQTLGAGHKTTVRQKCPPPRCPLQYPQFSSELFSH